MTQQRAEEEFQSIPLQFDMESAILELVRQRLPCFRIFAEAAKYRKKHTGQTAQFKTEKWFQAELLVHLWSKGLKVVPEYGPHRWDLYAIADSKDLPNYLLALKCLSDSAQSVSLDFESVRKDIEAVLDHHDVGEGTAYVVLVLPLSRRGRYCSSMLSKIRSDHLLGILEIHEHDLSFSTDSQEGVKLVWIGRRS